MWLNCLSKEFFIQIKTYLVCWTKKGKLVLNEVKPNVYREICL
ncbi:hypothetical protein FICEBENF_02602 [Aeromonas hydrophila]